MFTCILGDLLATIASNDTLTFIAGASNEIQDPCLKLDKIANIFFIFPVLHRFPRLAGWIDAMLKEPAVRATYIEPSQLVKYYHTRGIGKPEFNGVLQPPQYDIWSTQSEFKDRDVPQRKLLLPLPQGRIPYCHLFTCVIATKAQN